MKIGPRYLPEATEKGWALSIFVLCILSKRREIIDNF